MKITVLLTFLAASLVTAKNHGGNRGTASPNGNELKTYSSPGSMEEVNRIISNFNNTSLKPNTQFKGPVEGTFINPDNNNTYSEPGEHVIKNNLRNLNVFLPDTRYYVNSKVYPYRTVGTFGGCTATLVYDHGIIVTNAHCLDYDSVGNLASSTWSKVFYAGFSNGNYLGSSTAKALWYNRYLDYAVLKLKVYLDIPLGRYGVYWRTTSFFNTNKYLSMVSYSGDHCTSWSSCYAKRSSGYTRGLVLTKSLIGPTITDIRHDLDSKRGSSGSLMYEWPYKSCCPVMDALNHAEFRGGTSASLTLNSYVDKYANLARPSIDWKYGYDKIKYY